MTINWGAPGTASESAGARLRLPGTRCASKPARWPRTSGPLLWRLPPWMAARFGGVMVGIYPDAGAAARGAGNPRQQPRQVGTSDRAAPVFGGLNSRSPSSRVRFQNPAMVSDLQFQAAV